MGGRTGDLWRLEGTCRGASPPVSFRRVGLRACVRVVLVRGGWWRVWMDWRLRVERFPGFAVLDRQEVEEVLGLLMTALEDALRLHAHLEGMARPLDWRWRRCVVLANRVAARLVDVGAVMGGHVKGDGGDDGRGEHGRESGFD